MGLADLHIHSTYSWDGMSTVREILHHVAHHTQLNIIAITDHDEIGGALEALELAPSYGVMVIPGTEISTAEGHLLALFVHETIPPNLTLAETVLRVGEKGGLCIAAHPGVRGTANLSVASIRKALGVPGVAEVLAGVEVFNSRRGPDLRNGLDPAFAGELRLAHIGSSGSHAAATIGQGSTRFPGRRRADLRRALEERLTAVYFPGERDGRQGILSRWADHFVSRRAGPAEPRMGNSHPDSGT